MAILVYTLLPLPTTPIFLASGMARVDASYVIPAFFVGKFTSDAITVHLGKYASENIASILQKRVFVALCGEFNIWFAVALQYFVYRLAVAYFKEKTVA